MKTSLLVAGLVGSLVGGPAMAHKHTIFHKRGTLIDPGSTGQETAFKEVELADLNGDGRLDFYLPQKHAGGGGTPPMPNIDVVYLSTSSNLILAVDELDEIYEFRSTAVTFEFPLDTSRAYDVEVADLDEDGALDVIRPDRWGLLDILWGRKDPNTGKGDGTFDMHTDVFAMPGSNPNENCTTIGGMSFDGNYDDVDVRDFDGDGDLDFVVADRQKNCSTPPNPRNFVVENLKELALPGQKPDFAVRSVNAPDTTLPASLTHSIIAGDIDPPANPNLPTAVDVVASNEDHVAIYFGKINQPYQFDEPPLLLDGPHFDNGNQLRETVVADLVDLNRDGAVDLFVAENDVPNVTHGIYYHSGNNNNPYAQFSSAPMIDYAAVGISLFFYGLYDARYGDLDLDGVIDMDNDGIPDDGTMEVISVNQNVNNSGGVIPTVVQVLTVAADNTITDRTADFMQPATELTGGMGIDLGDLDNDGDLDLVLAGAHETLPDSVTASATVYENRSYTRIENRNLESGIVIGLRQLTAGNETRVLAGENVIFEAKQSLGGRIVLEDGFQAQSGSEFVANIR